MRVMEKRQVEGALREHFRRERLSAGCSAGHAAAVAALVAAETARTARRGAGVGDLVRTAIRFSPRAFWAALATVVALALALSLSGAPPHEAQAALVASGPVLVAACLAGVVRARSCFMSELEASCLHSAVSVACARFAVLGGATLLALAFACAACSVLVPVGCAAAYALAPYFVSAAGGLMLARRAAAADATIAAVAWSAGVGALCLLLRLAVPAAYSAGAIWVWAAVSAAGALWLVREAADWLRLCAEGGVASSGSERLAAF